MKLKVAMAWVRTHPVVSLAVSCCSFLLFLPRVQSLVIFFWPLLLSTALFVTALFTIGDSHDLQEERLDGENACMNGHHEENGVEECCVSTQVNHLERQRSLIDYVVEQHEGAIVHFDSLFEDPPEPSSGVVDRTQEEDRRLRAES